MNTRGFLPTIPDMESDIPSLIHNITNLESYIGSYWITNLTTQLPSAAASTSNQTRAIMAHFHMNHPILKILKSRSDRFRKINEDKVRKSNEEETILLFEDLATNSDFTRMVIPEYYKYSILFTLMRSDRESCDGLQIKVFIYQLNMMPFEHAYIHIISLLLDLYPGKSVTYTESMVVNQRYLIIQHAKTSPHNCAVNVIIQPLVDLLPSEINFLGSHIRYTKGYMCIDIRSSGIY